VLWRPGKLERALHEGACLYSSSFFRDFFLPSDSHCGTVFPLDTL